MRVEPKRSSPSCCEASDSSVSVTCCDFFREEQRQHHDQSRDAQQQEVGPGGSFERPHHHRFAARLAGDAPGVVAGQRHADEVHQVVAREGKGQREGSRQDRDAHDVEPHALENVEEERRRGPEGEERHEDVVADVGRNGGRDQSRAFQPLEQREIEDSGQRDAAPDGSPAAEDGGVAEREDEARNVHEKAFRPRRPAPPITGSPR